MLRLLEADKTGVGLQHLLLQLSVLHEYLCLGKEELEDGLSLLEGEFGMLSSLEQWFIKALEHVEVSGYDPASLGGRLLGLLTDSLQAFRSVARHSGGVLALLQQAAKEEGMDVCVAAVKALGAIMGCWRAL